MSHTSRFLDEHPEALGGPFPEQENKVLPGAQPCGEMHSADDECGACFEEACESGHQDINESASYRDAMNGAGRGHLLP